MEEHDDDLESEVREGAQTEEDAYPDTGDELNDLVSDTPDRTDRDPVLADDEGEL